MTLGFLAAFFTAIAFIPQAYRTIKTRESKGLSLGMYTLLCLGMALWLVYGFAINDYPLIISNSITFVLSCLIWFLKFREKQ